MAHFAQLDENNIVIQVIVINNSELLEGDVESEVKGIVFCRSLFPNTNWKQISYSGSIRKNYAGSGFTYDPKRDAFIPPQPYPSWLLNEYTCLWEAPVPYPTDTKFYIWNEETLSWVLDEQDGM